MTAPTRFTNVTSDEGYEVGGTRVIAERQAAIADLAGSDSTTEELHDKVNDILEALRAHGLIAE